MTTLWPVSCEREFYSLQGKVSFTLQPRSAVFLLCKREKIPFAKESRSHDTGQCLLKRNTDDSKFLLHELGYTNYHLALTSTKRMVGCAIQNINTKVPISSQLGIANERWTSIFVMRKSMRCHFNKC
jgi:hypothetical protein